MQFKQTISVTVIEIQKPKISQLTLDEKVAITRRVCPLPEIEISQSGISNNKYTSSLNTE